MEAGIDLGNILYSLQPSFLKRQQLLAYRAKAPLDRSSLVRQQTLINLEKKVLEVFQKVTQKTNDSELTKVARYYIDFKKREVFSDKELSESVEED